MKYCLGFRVENMIVVASCVRKVQLSEAVIGSEEGETGDDKREKSMRKKQNRSWLQALTVDLFSKGKRARKK